MGVVCRGVGAPDGLLASSAAMDSLHDPLPPVAPHVAGGGGKASRGGLGRTVATAGPCVQCPFSIFPFISLCFLVTRGSAFYFHTT